MKITCNHTDHTLIIDELERSIKNYNWDFVLPFLPQGSFLVGGYIRDIILGRIHSEVDIDIVVPSNAIDIGLKISKKCKGKFIVLDKERKVVRIILDHISIDIANQVSSSLIKDLQSRDFTINSIAFLFDKKCLFDPLNGIKDIEKSLLRSFSKINLLDDPLRILRCIRFVSELDFNIDKQVLFLLKKYKRKLNYVANERINYEIQRIVNGVNALEAITILKKLNLFELEKFYKDSVFVNLKTINNQELNPSEKKKFLPLFLIGQILDDASLEKFKFSKAQITNIKLLRKWHFVLRGKNIYQLNESERFELHKELEDILPSFLFYLPQKLHSDWLKRWRDKNDKLFHPSYLINGDVIKKHFQFIDGPLLGQLLNHLSMELAYDRLNNFDEAIYKAKLWIEQNAPKCD